MHNPVLFVRDCDISGAIGLSNQNERLLTQRGAILCEGTGNVLSSLEKMGAFLSDEKAPEENQKNPSKSGKNSVLGGLKKFGAIFKKKKSTSKFSEESDDSRIEDGKNDESSMIEEPNPQEVKVESERSSPPPSRPQFFNHRNQHKAVVFKKEDIDSMFEEAEEEGVEKGMN